MRTDFVGGRIHQVDTIKMSGTAAAVCIMCVSHSVE